MEANALKHGFNYDLREGVIHMAVNVEAAKRELLNLPKDDLTVDWIVAKFGNRSTTETNSEGKRTKFAVQPPEWNFRTKVHLKKGEYINTRDVDTTLGRILFNRLLIEDTVQDILDGHYFNETLTKKSCGKMLTGIIPAALMEKKIALMPNVTAFIQAFEFWGLMLVGPFGASMSPGILSVNEDIRKYRDDLYEN